MSDLKENFHVDFYKELYVREVERVIHVQQRFQWSISIWILLLAGIVYVFNKSENFKTDMYSVYVPLVISALFILVSMALILIGLYFTEIKHIPSAGLNKERYLKIKEHYESLDQNEYNVNQGNIEEEFKRTLEKNYIRATDDMMVSNERRIKLSHYANITMGISGFFLLVAFLIKLFI